MAFLAAVLPAAIGVAGSIMQGQEAKRAADRQTLPKLLEARQLERQSGQVKAASQRAAGEETKRAELIASRALALTAAGGGGTADPTVVNLIADINNEGAYRHAMALYQGEEQAKQLRFGGDMARREADIIRKGGAAAARASNWQAASYAAQGASSLYTKYGGTKKPATPGTGAATIGAGGIAAGTRTY